VPALVGSGRGATLRIATRSSAQARTQAEIVGAAIEAASDGVRTELVLVDTIGDQRQDVPLHTIGGQGVFVKEIQRAVLDGRADIAVHSAKDLPSAHTEGLTIGAFTVRRDPRDALIGSSLDGLALGATVATGSVRRRAQLAALRPDLQFVELRGNIQTRLSKIPQDGAIVMAVAALQVLGIE
jgi:hydroxymethylbilane synthase